MGIQLINKDSGFGVWLKKIFNFFVK